MLLLDTDHISEIERGSGVGARLMTKLKNTIEPSTISIVSAEESLRGWLHLIRKAATEKSLAGAYNQFQNSLVMLSKWTVLPWTIRASELFKSLRAQEVRIATMDLRIASIALAFDATLLSRNQGDFRQVPGLRIENWLD